MKRFVVLAVIGILMSGLTGAVDAASMPREDVIDVPAISEGLCLHNVFQSNMVIQRDKPINIWGWAKPGEDLTVTFGGVEQMAKADKDRSWKASFPAVPASSVPIELLVKGAKDTLSLTNILIGDVWLLGGQSNMEFPITRVENGQLEVISANYPNIRILTVPALKGPELKTSFPRLYEWSGWFGRHYRKGDWDVCSPETAGELSAIGYVFARRVHMAAQVPIGVIDVSRGGTTVETWTPAAALKQVDTEQVKTLLTTWDAKVAEWDPKADLANRLQRHEQKIAKMKKEGKAIPDNMKPPTDLLPGPAMDQNRPGNCYASMIAPIAGLAVKGAIFHQGYNNCFNGTEGAVMYAQVFPKMIEAWRAAFNDAAMPFGILSLCTQGSRQTREDFCQQMFDAGPYVREAQYKTFLDLYKADDKNIGFASAYDLRRRWYHPQLKVPAGERMARWALATQYGFEKQVLWKPPMVNEMVVNTNGQIVLHMDGNTAAVDDGGPIEGFAIAGADRKFHPANAEHFVKGKDSRGRPQRDTKILVLSSPMVPEPVHYRYAWARSPMGNVQLNGNTDVPMATQRSDDWPMENIPLGVLGDPPPEEIDRGHRSTISKALRAEDLRRQLTEARLLLKTNKTE